jgi:hypothetical protein
MRLLAALLLLLPVAVQAQFNFTTNNGTITITKYTGSGGAVVIPSTTNGWPVTCIGDYAFTSCSGLTKVTIPDTVTSIGFEAFAWCNSLTSIRIPDSVTSIKDQAFLGSGLTNVTIPNSVRSIQDDAFGYCISLTNITIPGSVTGIGSIAFYYCVGLAGVFFTGNSPDADSTMFWHADNAIVYYLPETTNWDSTFADHPTVLWNLQVQISDATFGVQTNRFGFTITGVPLQSCALTNGSLYFSDPQWTNYPRRFYHLRWP